MTLPHVHVPGQLALLEPGERPRMLDGFCGAGGISVGYERAGFDVTGIDKHVQPRYPGLSILQADMLDVLRDVAYLRTFHVVHCSAPCQPYSRRMRHLSAPVPALLQEVRRLLIASGVPWILENVVGAEPYMPGHVSLCGTGLGLRVRRERLFEASVPLVGAPCDHSRPALNPHSQQGRDAIYREFGRQDPEPLWLEHMGLGWMSRYEGREAVPPVFSEHVGRQVMIAYGWNADEPRTRVGVRGS
jgi:DNA (cytosine-5)-methyltransferase 1